MKKHKLTKDTLCPEIFKIDKDLLQDWQHFCVAGQNHEEFEELFEFYMENGNLFAKMSNSPNAFDMIVGNYMFKLNAAGGKQAVDSFIPPEI